MSDATGGRTLIPVSLLTGFLGSGKTTLLNHAVRHPLLADSAVLVNEVGAIGLDHHLVRSAKPDVVLLEGGCMCCTVRGELSDTLRDLLFRRGRDGVSKFNRMLIETTGLADPAPILQSLLSDPIVAQHYRLDGVITTVDGVLGMDELDRHFESVKQAAVADRLVLTKCDAAPLPGLERLEARLRELNPAAPIYRSEHGQIDPALLLNAGLFDPSRKIADVTRWLAAAAYRPVSRASLLPGQVAHASAHDERIRSFTLSFERPIPWAGLMAAMEMLLSFRGEDLLRVKGILNLEGQTQPVVMQSVQSVLYPLTRLDVWPDEDRRTRLVFIVRDLDPGFIEDVLRQFIDAAQAPAEVEAVAEGDHAAPAVQPAGAAGGRMP
ncbi:MAG TPA: GTP-binding protein [Burkholderiales bacterium]|nr:GTP-binding protein [Betaproteobacteria bacterium]HQR51652.1 GTP-binding protein [Burkholderiales bacterium]